MDVIVAARLSQDYSGQTGIESQDEDTVSWAREQGHNVVAVIADHKSGAADWMDRKKLRPWLTQPAKLVQYQGIIAARQDRLSRGKWRDEIAIRTWAEDNRKEIFIVDSGLHWPPRDMGEQIRWELDASRARQRWEEDSRQYSRMQKYLREAKRPDGQTGYLVGRPPYGFRVVGVRCGNSPCDCENDDHKTLEPDPVTGEVVQQMVDMYLDGSTRRDIALWLDAAEVPVPNRKKGRQTGQKWTGHGVMVILHSETLVGKRKDGKGRVILRFDPLISQEKFDKLQAEAARRARGGGHSKENTSMLAGVAYCAACGGPLHYREPRKLNKNGTVYVWRGYRCDGTEKARSTCKVMINAASLDGWVTEQMTGLPHGPKPVMEVTVNPGPTYEREIEDIEDRIRGLDFDHPQYEQRHRELLGERKRFLKLREDAKPELQRTKTEETVAERWLRSTDLERRDYLIRAGAKVYAAGKTPADGWRLDVDEPNVLAAA